jgi:putative tryptophan/tyrosine transport system substrate-binding protein
MMGERASRAFDALLLLFSVVLVEADIVAAERAIPVKIGALTASWGPTLAVVALRDGLQELGYRENTDFVIGVRFTEGNAAELPAAARDLVRGGANILVTDGSGDAAKAAQIAALERIPVVFMRVTDPVPRGLIRSFARPGGNITGVADPSGLAAKRLEIFRELVPGLKRVLVPYDASELALDLMLAEYRAAAHRLGVILVEKPLRTQEEARVAVADIPKGQVDGILSPRWLSLNIPGFMVEAASRKAAPTMFHDAFYVERGGLASYSANSVQVGRQAARLVDQIIKGKKPADLPVEQPTKFELVINLKTAKALGLTIPPSLLARADQVIE